MSPAPDSSPLLAAFDALSIDDIYTMAPKEFVIRGYGYYQQQRLRHYIWSPDHLTLTARVQGTRLYTVMVSAGDGGLAASCDCPAWHPDWLCKHVLCVCFTTKNLLSPDTFRLPDRQRTRLSALRAELLGDVREPRGQPGATHEGSVRNGPIYEIVIDTRPRYPQLLIHRNGAPLAGGWAPTLPAELLPFLTTSRFSSGFGEDPLLHYLRLHHRPYPILLKSGQESIPLQWSPSVKCRSKTEIDLVGDQVRIRAVCLADEAALDRIVRFRTFVVDWCSRRLLYLEDERGWASFRSLQQRLCLNEIDPFLEPDHLNPGLRAVTLPDEFGYGRWQGVARKMEFTVSLDEFHSAHIDLIQQHAERTLRDLILKVDRKDSAVRLATSPPASGAPSYALILTPPPDAPNDLAVPWKMRAQCQRGDERFAPSASTVPFLPELEHGRGVSGPLRAQKRKAVLYATFFKLCAVHDATKRNHCIKAALVPECWSRAVSEEACQWLRHHLSIFARPDLRLQIREGCWELRPVDKAREVAFYRIPFEVFGPVIFRGMQRRDEMAVDARMLLQRLPGLLEKLTAAGIHLFYEDKPVQTSRWECAVEVRRGVRKGIVIDWFELRPEIRCDGMALEEAEWRTVLQSGGVVHTERGLRVLDGQSMARLRAIMGLTEQAMSAREGVKIVRVPRLHILDWIALREKGITVSLPAEDEAVLARLLGFQRIAPPPLPDGLCATLRPYQGEGYAWLAFLYEHRFGACLADDMGLGKTLQAICLLVAIKEGRVQPPADVKGPHLVIVPTSLVFNWVQELARFAPGLKVHVYSGSERTLDAKDSNVVLTTYGLVRRDIETLKQTAFHVVVFDEAQAVKNLFADTTGAVRRLTGHFKIAMTGTPLENHLGEYFSIVDVCLPGLLGDYERFKAELKRVQGPALDRLLRRTRPFILRRTKAQILRDLPPKIESEVFLDLTHRQKTLYQQTVAQVRSTIDEAYRDKTPAQAQIIALTAILKLRQICLSPRLLTKRDEEPSPKLSFLVEQLRVLLDEGHSALVFSQFTSFLDLVEEACARHALPYNRLDGSTAPASRKTKVTAFQTSDQPSVFLLSLKAGGQGLNLTKATYVFHLDPWWNPAVENQASDRAHRIGQQRTVSIVRLLMRHTIEEKMMALKQRKLDLYQAVMGGAMRGAGQGVLTKADFEFLLSRTGTPAAMPG